uniref:CHCH domain-containing protein n=1 Tax=Caenorhabditis tropicalis TaxID=1561998 RepID=A0A1I7UJU8_9PELO
MLIRRACEMEPSFSFCRNHAKTAEIRTESQKKRDVFLQWAYVSAKDDQDIEDVDELETTRKKPDRISDYCKNYAHNYNSYCMDGHLEKLEGLLSHFCIRYTKNCKVAGKPNKMEKIRKTETVFPTPMPFFSTTPLPTVGYCDGNAMKYKMECEKEGFMPEDFCRKYKDMCGKLEKVDADTTKSVVDEADSLELPDEFEENEKEERVESEKVKPEEQAEGQGVGTDEVTAYCTNYIENYNFYCVGDMVPEHEKFCNSYKKNCPDRVS